MYYVNNHHTSADICMKLGDTVGDVTLGRSICTFPGTSRPQLSLDSDRVQLGFEVSGV